MTQDEAVSHWRKRAYAELKAAQTLFEKKDPDLYGEVLFNCHLAIELALKAEYIRRHNIAAPFTHNLGELASSLKKSWTDEERSTFDQLSEFAVLARYGDERWFVEHATREAAAHWLKKTESFLSEVLS